MNNLPIQSLQIYKIGTDYLCFLNLTLTFFMFSVLSVCSSNKTAIVDAGGLQALALHLGKKLTDNYVCFLLKTTDSKLSLNM